MKKALMLLSAALAINVALPDNSAAAQHSSVVRRVVDRCDRCHQPVFAQRYVAGHTRKGNLIYRWRTLNHQHRHARPNYAYREWDGYERDSYVRDRYDPRWRDRQYRSSPSYFRLPGMSVRIDDR